ncbi:MAG TPA: hypothetical protein VNT99_05445 [Methylomirabilota bacterium]|nr:hypothetical protein [Methylomirabilota bacterium]
MKTPNSLEDVMRSWTARGPSPRIEAELFGAERKPNVETRKRGTHHLPWWKTLGASAAAFGVAILTLLNVTQFSVGGASPGGWLSLSNHSCAASFAMASAPINTWRAPILSWTNEGASGSNARSFDLLITNRILR